MLSRDSKDEICSRFVFELVIWPQDVTLARWTQPSGPLCHWQCFTILFPPSPLQEAFYKQLHLSRPPSPLSPPSPPPWCSTVSAAWKNSSSEIKAEQKILDHAIGWLGRKEEMGWICLFFRLYVQRTRCIGYLDLEKQTYVRQNVTRAVKKITAPRPIWTW